MAYRVVCISRVTAAGGEAIGQAGYSSGLAGRNVSPMR